MDETAFSQITDQIFIDENIVVIACAVFFMFISAKAYKNTHEKKTIYLIAAFVLFAFQHIFLYVDYALSDFVADDIRHIVFGITTITIMVMFFLAIIRK